MYRGFKDLCRREKEKTWIMARKKEKSDLGCGGLVKTFCNVTERFYGAFPQRSGHSRPFSRNSFLFERVDVKRQ